jgi:hypothetical protein
VLNEQVLFIAQLHLKHVLPLNSPTNEQDGAKIVCNSTSLLNACAFATPVRPAKRVLKAQYFLSNTVHMFELLRGWLVPACRCESQQLFMFQTLSNAHCSG